MVIIAPRLVVLPERFTFEPRAASAALEGPLGRLLVLEPHPELVDGRLVVELLPQVDELPLPQLLPEELREEPQLELLEELNDDERLPPLEKPPLLPPRAKLSAGRTIANARRSAIKTR